jgi:hypothetical protein
MRVPTTASVSAGRNGRRRRHVAQPVLSPGPATFRRADFHCSPLHAVDSDATVAGVLAFLSLKPGDTDSEYFEGYTPGQRAFARAEGENLSRYAEDLERR